MAIGTAKIRVPRNIKKGKPFKLQFIIIHPMEPGTRKDKKTGKLIPAHHITKLDITFNGKKVTHMDVGGAVSANPYFAVMMKADESGTIEISYEDNKGGKWKKSVKVNVS